MVILAFHHLVLFYVFWSLDSAVIPNLNMGWFMPDFLLVGFLIAALHWSVRKTFLAGIIIGSLMDGYGPGNSVFYLMLLSAMGVVFSIQARRLSNVRLLNAYFVTAVGVLAINLGGALYLLAATGRLFFETNLSYAASHLVSNAIIVLPMWVVCRTLFEKEKAHAA